jgi:ketosteroid isomerase-like protein
MPSQRDKAVAVAVDTSELSPALRPLAWWLGDWKGESGTEHWVAADGAIYGIALHGGTFEVMIVDDGEGERSVEFKQETLGASAARFANPAHDDPKAISYARAGSTLHATLHGAKDTGFAFAPTTRTPAPELEEADKKFAAETAARGADGWMAAFDPKGGMLRKGVRIEGPAIQETMAPLLSSGLLAWAPIASGRDGAIGFTVGKATFTGKTPDDHWASTYVTIWRQQDDGGWKVLFDTGRAVNTPAPTN